MDACPDFFNRGGWPSQFALTLNPIEGFETTSDVEPKLPTNRDNFIS